MKKILALFLAFLAPSAASAQGMSWLAGGPDQAIPFNNHGLLSWINWTNGCVLQYQTGTAVGATNGYPVCLTTIPASTTLAPNSVTASMLAPGAAAGNLGGTVNIPSPAHFSINQGGVSGNTGTFYMNAQMAPGGASLTPSFLIQDNLYGVLGASSPFLNQISVADSADGSSPQAAYWLYVGGTFGGSSAKGGRVAVTGSMNVTTATGNTAPFGNNYYIGVGANASSNVNDNGTSGNPAGSLFGSSSSASLNTGGTYWGEVVSWEGDIAVQTGASTLIKTGAKIVTLTGDAVQGSQTDDALAFNSQTWTAPGWKNGITFGDSTGYWPMSSTGVLIGTNAQIVGTGHSVSYAAATGIDFSAVAFSSYFLKSTGFSVDGSGNVIAPTVTGPSSAILYITGGTGQNLGLGANGANGVWYISTGGTFYPNTSNATDIGLSSNFVRNVYARQIYAESSLPAISSCGSSPPAASAGSGNMGGQFTLGTGATAACTVTFANAFPANAYCTVTPATAYTGTYYVSAQSNSAFTVTLGIGTASVKFNYACNGN